jgi:hypothetical protein
MQNSECEEKTKFSERTSRSFDSKSQALTSHPTPSLSSVAGGATVQPAAYTEEQYFEGLEAWQRELELQAELDYVYAEVDCRDCHAYHGEQIARHVHALIDQDHDNVDLYVENQDNDNGNLVEED